MNFLAHAFLSFDRPEILAGNMIADFVRGKQQYVFSSGIQRGITLHRGIDTFTDHHEATREAKKVFIPACGRYSGAFMDVVYDHFLATDPHYFNKDSLVQFAHHVYSTLNTFDTVFPDNFKRSFHYMQQQDWLSGYYFKENIFKSFRRIYYRAKYLEESDAAFVVFEAHYNSLKEYYFTFMPDVVEFATQQLLIPLKPDN